MSAAPALASQPWPLGATCVPGGVNLAVAAPVAQRVEACLFDATGQAETTRLPLQRGEGGVWHGAVPGAGPGLVYGYRAHGPWAPAQGLRCNPAKLLLDPCAHAVVGRYDGSDLMLAHSPQDPAQPDPRDNAAVALKARAVALPPPLPEAAHVRVPAARSVLYELHLKAATMRHPEVPEGLRGTYAGLAHPAVGQHLRRLGVTTVCLMPLHQRVDEPRLLALGLTNHWGYNPVAWAAPEQRFASPAGPGALVECRAMVAALHAQGLEVVLDVVFNHSAELDADGPLFHLRGLDNTLYYRLQRQDPALYCNATGCGNALNLAQPLVLRMVMDALRFWVQTIGVDGFRFDLATSLLRTDQGVDPQAPFLAALAQDPVLAGTKLIAEPWDLGHGGYRLGGFPPGWAEWNDCARDTLRRYWLRRSANRGELAHVLAGSSTVFAPSGRGPAAGINFITAHDGFTLADLVSHQERHNHANGEDNRDGHAHNHSTHCGVEGPTQDPAVRACRARLQRALLANLLCSLGTPMLLAGDELGHSQQGNNNAYCQDNPGTWLHWAQGDAVLTAFVARCTALRAQVLAACPGGGQHWLADTDVAWRTPEGEPMASADWEHPHDHGLAVWLGPTRARQWLLLANADDTPRGFVLPGGAPWRLALRSDQDTADSPLAPQVELPGQALWLALRDQPDHHPTKETPR